LKIGGGKEIKLKQSRFMKKFTLVLVLALISSVSIAQIGGAPTMGHSMIGHRYVMQPSVVSQLNPLFDAL
jgi:hypothetical protein